MHPLFKKADDLSREVIGVAIEVHRLKGAGLIESICEKCLMLNIPAGLVLNFHELKLADGMSRMILPGANR